MISKTKLAILLASLTALTPFSIDVYLPALPFIAQDLGADIHKLELALGIFLLGAAMGQLFGGPLSDRFGRKPIALTGLTIYCLATILIALSRNADELLVMRAVHAFGGGFATIIALAVIRDRYHGVEAAKLFALMGVIMTIAPLIAPSLGAVLFSAFGWRFVFVFLVFYAAFLFLIVLVFLPETNKAVESTESRKPFFREAIGRFADVFSVRKAVGFILCQAFCLGTMFAFLTESSFVYIRLYHVTPQIYAFLFAGNIVTMMAFNRLTAWLLNTHRPIMILAWGLAVQFSATGLFLLFTVLFKLPPLPLSLGLIMLCVGSMGLIAPNTLACYMEFFPKNGGTANAVMGTAQSTIGACIGMLVSFLHNGTLFPMAGVMFCSTSLGIILFLVVSKPYGRAGQALQA